MGGGYDATAWSKKLSRERGAMAPNTDCRTLTVGLHQFVLHVVGHQGIRQFGEKALHGSSHGIHGEVLLGKVQIVVCKEKI